MSANDEALPEVSFNFYLDFTADVQVTELKVGSIHKATASSLVNTTGYQARFVQP